MRLHKKLLTAVFWGAVLSCSTNVPQAKHFSLTLKDHLNQITRHIYNDEFQEAGDLIDSLQYLEDAGLMTHLFRAILYQARMMTAESDFLEPDFFSVLDSLEDKSHEILAAGGDSALSYFCLGHAQAFRSLYYGRSGQTWQAIKAGLRARNAYGRAYRNDSTFHDIALGLGSYRYWKTVKTNLINWTPLFKREKSDGIDLLRLAVDSSEISSDAARAALIWIYINEKLYGEAIRMADLMRRKYPRGLTFSWAMAEAAYEIADYRLSGAIYSDILERLRDNPGNYYNIVEAGFYISQCYGNLARKNPAYKDSLDLIKKEIRSLPVPEKTRKRQKNKLKKILNPPN